MQHIINGVDIEALVKSLHPTTRLLRVEDWFCDTGVPVLPMRFVFQIPGEWYGAGALTNLERVEAVKEMLRDKGLDRFVKIEWSGSRF